MSPGRMLLLKVMEAASGSPMSSFRWKERRFRRWQRKYECDGSFRFKLNE